MSYIPPVDSGELTYSGSLTWTGTTAPSGTATHRYQWTRVGKLVTGHVSIWFVTNGTGLTNLVAELPADFPTPLNIGSIAAADDFVIRVGATGYVNRTTMPSAVARAFLKRNAAGNGYELTAATAALQLRGVQFVFSYFIA